MAESTTSIPTPVPTERALLAIVEEATFANNPDILPATETRYDECSKYLIAKDYEKKWGSYLYTGPQGPYGMLFAKAKTVEEANTPFRSTSRFGNHRWPPILLYLGFEVDYVSQRSFPVSNGTDIGTGFAPTYYDKVVYIPDVAEGTRFLKEEFFGPREFVIPQTPVPIPTAVQYILPGGGGQSFPECLHPTIRIPDFISSLTQTVAGATTAVGGAVEGQLFPATNFETWAPYILSDEQEQRDGGWYRVRIRIFPPAQPEPIVRLSR